MSEPAIYPSDYAARVGFDRLVEQCAALCTMQRSVAKLREQTFSSEHAEVQQRLRLTAQMHRLLEQERDCPREEYSDIDALLSKIGVEGMFLDVEEVVALGKALRSASDMASFIRSREDGLYPQLAELAAPIALFAELLREIDRIVDAQGRIKDNASEELLRVRREIRSREGQVSKRLQAILQTAKSSGVVDADASISIRDGRAVIPVQASNKRKIAGFIHDESATGKTFYVEPVEVVELNNELRELEYAERRETVRILTAFTDFARVYLDSIADAEEFLATVDMLRAKARWAILNGAVMPILSTDGTLRLQQARHPLLSQTLRRQQRTIVPLDAELDAKQRVLIISGPNAGGKSVCLKTFGILQYMLQCGYEVTASENSEFPLFDKLYIDIGDQQSIDNDLSTYSSHLINMRAMLSGADARTLVMIDEFGSGTEPIIGGAIAESILERLVERGTYGVITTHYSNIKYFAASHEGIRNGAMMFDVQNIRPLFRLETGKPGSSFAIEIARKIGLPEDIIRSAGEKAGEEHINLEKQLREIARDKHYWEQKRDRIRLTDRKVGELEEDYRTRLSAIRDERAAIIKAAKVEARQLVADANKTIENTIKTIREAQAEKELTRLARKELEEFRDNEVENNDTRPDDERLQREMERLERRNSRREERRAEKATKVAATVQPKIVPPKIEVGTKVRLSGQELAGVVQSIKGKRAQVAFGQILTTVELSRLSVVSAAEYRAQTRPETPRTVISSDISQRRLNFRAQIDIRGMRVAEALEAVQNLVDDALMVGVENITILHGKGTGALKDEVRKMLRSMSEVENVADEHADRGGAGITNVKFKF